MTDYEKTIIELALSYATYGYSLKYDDDISEIAQMLEIDYDLFYKALNNGDSVLLNQTALFEGEQFQISIYQPLLDTIIRYFIITKCLQDTEDTINTSTLTKNYELYLEAINEFEVMNAFFATSEAERADSFPYYEYLLFDKDAYVPKNDLDIYQSLIYKREYLINENTSDIDQLLRLLQLTMKYNLQTHANTLYLVAIAQIISRSSFFNDRVKSVAREFFMNTITMLRNGRVIAVQANTLYQDLKKDHEIRTKQADNTTRLQVMYGFDNFDTYELRLDLAHQGEGFIHYNNLSPGGIKCCLFTLEEYHKVIEEYPDLRDCFVVYANQAALKERKNCPFTSEMKDHYEIIRSKQEHIRAVSSTFQEIDLIDFLDIVKRMLPKSWVGRIDKDGIFAKYCFDHDILMTRATILCHTLLVNDAYDTYRLLEYLSNKAVLNGLIEYDEQSLYDDAAGICDLICQSNNRIFEYSGQRLI